MYKMLPLNLCFFMACTCASGQTGPVLVGSSYGLPSFVTIVPGQILRLEVVGLKTVITSASESEATKLPLPTTLSGISVMLTQFPPFPGGTSFPLPIINVSQETECDDSSTPDCVRTSITVQIPYEIMLPNGFSAAKYEFVISETGAQSKAFLVTPMTDNIHIVTSCDIRAPFHIIPCQPIVTHVDGGLITPKSPAQPGEEVVIYAWGLGKTNPLAKTGDATPAPAPTVLSRRMVVDFDFRPNAMASRPYVANGFVVPEALRPLFAGLTPGEVGLYQINVRIPDALPPMPACTSDLTPFTSILTNLTIDIGSDSSFDGAGICVQPQQIIEPPQ